MKKTICFVLVLCTVVLFPFSVLGSSVDSYGINALLTSLNDDALSDNEYWKASYDYRQRSIVVEMACDELTATLIEMCEETDYTTEAWDLGKDSLVSLCNIFKSLLPLYDLGHISVILYIVNDDAYIRNDYSTALYNPLLVIKDGEVVFDIVQEMRAN